MFYIIKGQWVLLLKKERKMSKIGEAALDIASGGVSSLIGAGMGMFMNSENDKKQLEQQQKLSEQQAKIQKDLNRSQLENQMELWERTNYSAQMKQLKDAGLNAGLIYGMSGGGGATASASTGGGISGGNADGASARSAIGIQTASQIALMQAQKENIEADTENKKAQIPKVGAEAENITQDTVNKTLLAENQKLDLEFNKIRNEIQSETKENTINGSTSAVNKLNEEVRKLQSEISINTSNAEILKRSKETIIKKYNAELENIMAKTIESESGNKVNIVMAEKLAKDINLGYAQLEVQMKGQEVSLEQTRQMANSIMISAGINAVGNLSGGLAKMLMSKRGITTETVRYDKNGNESSSTTRTRGN